MAGRVIAAGRAKRKGSHHAGGSREGSGFALPMLMTRNGSVNKFMLKRVDKKELPHEDEWIKEGAGPPARPYFGNISAARGTRNSLGPSADRVPDVRAPITLAASGEHHPRASYLSTASPIASTHYSGFRQPPSRWLQKA